MDQPNSSAPVSAYAEIEIAAPRPQVWAILVDVAAWPTWNPAIRQSVRDPDFEVGSRFRFSTEIGTLKCRVTAVDPPSSLSWRGRVLLLGERQTWRLEPTDTGTRVAFQAEMTGLVAHLLRRRLTERLQAVVDSVLHLLCLEAEMRTAERDGLPGLATAAGGGNDD